MSTPNLPELLKLPVAKRIQLAQDLWDSIPADSAALQLTGAAVEKGTAHGRAPR
jgi:hypothetical protein